MSDSTVTVSFYAPVEQGAKRLVNVVVIKQTEKSKREEFEVILFPIIILFIIASLMVYFLLKVKPTGKVNSTLDKVEKILPRF